MAKLKGILKIEGTLDELTFYKTQDGHLVKTKGGVSAAPLKGWRGVVALRVGWVGKKHGFTFDKKCYGVGYLT